MTPVFTPALVAQYDSSLAERERCERKLTYLYGKIIAWLCGVIPTHDRSFLVLPYDYDTHREPFPVNGGDEDFVVYYIGGESDTVEDPPQPFIVDRLSVDRDPNCYFLGKTREGLPVFAFVTSHS